MKPKELAERKYREAMHAKEVLSLSEYEVFDYHDGILENTEELRKKAASSIRDWDADVVFTRLHFHTFLTSPLILMKY
jgi:LmbE family N-acetylglucosaminyl deacetylase